MAEQMVKIKVLGAGGAGGNAINDMITTGVAGVEFIAANTDAQDLNRSLADVRIQLGEKLTRGLGAGANPDIGKESAEEDYDKVKQLLEDTDMLFITAGMGGGTGTGSSPVIAKIARELGILTVGVVTKPFGFEGGKRKSNAKRGIEDLQKHVDSLVIIPNDKLFELPDKTITLQNAFKEANNILKIGIKGVADLMIGNGLINLDFADIRATMENSGIAVLGFGEAEGENRAVKATEKALSSPLLEKSISGASKILLNIAGSSSLELMEANLIANIVREAAGKDADDVMFGVNIDEELENRIEVTIIANNFLDEPKLGEISKPQPQVQIQPIQEKVEPPKKEIKHTNEFINLSSIQTEPESRNDDNDIELPPWIRNRK